MLTISNNSIEKIIDAEISSEAYYNKFLAAPSWPTGQSVLQLALVMIWVTIQNHKC